MAMENDAPPIGPDVDRRPEQIDRGLVARLQAGDLSALDELVAAHQDRVARLAERLLGSPGPVDDVVQEVFLAVLRGTKGFRGQCEFTTWLTAIAVNKCRTYGRWRRRWSQLFRYFRPADAIPAAGEGPAEDYARVHDAVRRLPPKHREPIVLHYFEEMPIAEVAQSLGLSVNAVQMRLSRARQHLKRILTAGCERGER